VLPSLEAETAVREPSQHQYRSGVNALALHVLTNLELTIFWPYRVFDAVVEDGIRLDASVLSLY
jgi:hypothetical protein